MKKECCIDLYAGLLGRKRAYPFGPALAVGTYLVLLA